VTYFLFADKTAIGLAFEAGDLDAVSSMYDPIPHRDVPRYEAMNGVLVDTWPGNTFTMLRFNFREEAVTANPWLSDKRVRQAFSKAIDRSLVVESLYAGYGTPTYGMVHKDMVSEYYNPAIEEIVSYDPTGATDLLDEAGYAPDQDGIRISSDCLMYAEISEFAEVMREMLLEVGIQLNLVAVEHGTFLNTYEKGPEGLQHHPLAMLTEINGPEPTQSLPQLHSDYTPDKGGWNFCFYSNATLDEEFDIAATAASSDEVKTALYKGQLIVAQDAPIVYVAHPSRVCVWREEFKGYPTRPDPWYWDAHGGPNTDVWWTGAPYPTTDVTGLVALVESLNETMTTNINAMTDVVNALANWTYVIVGIQVVTIVLVAYAIYVARKRTRMPK
jgi:peptide/nickel transport system substrate-binding protein